MTPQPAVAGYPPVGPGGMAQPGAEPATLCPRCGSDKLVPSVQLSVVGGGTVVLLTPDGNRAVLTASVCGQCGLVQLTADSPKLLYAALRG